jgi:hypothetical protein
LAPFPADTDIIGYTFKADEGPEPYFTPAQITGYFDDVYKDYINPGNIATADLLKFELDQFQIDVDGNLIFELVYHVKEIQTEWGAVIAQESTSLGSITVASGSPVPAKFNGLSSQFDIGPITWTDKNGAVPTGGSFDSGDAPYKAVFTLTHKGKYVFDDTFDLNAWKIFHLGTTNANSLNLSTGPAKGCTVDAEVLDTGDLRITLTWATL